MEGCLFGTKIPPLNPKAPSAPLAYSGTTEANTASQAVGAPSSSSSSSRYSPALAAAPTEEEEEEERDRTFGLFFSCSHIWPNGGRAVEGGPIGKGSNRTEIPDD